MLSLTIIAFTLNLIAAVLNTYIGFQGKSTFNLGLAMFNWLLTGAFLAALAHETGL